MVKYNRVKGEQQEGVITKNQIKEGVMLAGFHQRQFEHVLRQVGLPLVAGQYLLLYCDIQLQLAADKVKWEFPEHLLQSDILLQGDVEVYFQEGLAYLEAREIEYSESLVGDECLDQSCETSLIGDVFVFRDVKERDTTVTAHRSCKDIEPNIIETIFADVEMPECLVGSQKF